MPHDRSALKLRTAFTKSVVGAPHEHRPNPLVMEDTRPTTALLHCSPLRHGRMAKLMIV